MRGRSAFFLSNYVITRSLFNGCRISPELLAETDLTHMAISEKVLANQRTEITLSNGLSFIMASKACSKGAYGAIYQVFLNEDDPHPTYLVKEFGGLFTDDDFIDHHQEHAAQAFMGRHACLFTLDANPAMLTEWQPGETLMTIPREEIVKHSLETRMLWLRSLFLQLKQLHDHGYVHYDLESRNVILNVEKNEMYIIDLGYIGEIKNSWSIANDMRAVAYLIKSHLFPDLYYGNTARFFAPALLGNRLAIGITELVKAIEKQTDANAFHCDDAITFCDKLLVVTEEKVSHKFT